MGLSIARTDETQYNPVFQAIMEDNPGGVTLALGDLKSATEEVKAGAVIGEGSTAGLFHLIKTAEVYADAESATILVEKEHEFKVGDFISNGLGSSAIISITTTETLYDTIVVTNGLTVSDGDALYQSTSEGVEVADLAYKYTPSAISRNEAVVTTYSVSGSESQANVSVGAVVRGTVVESLLPFVVTTGIKTALTDRIRFA